MFDIIKCIKYCQLCGKKKTVKKRKKNMHGDVEMEIMRIWKQEKVKIQWTERKSVH